MAQSKFSLDGSASGTAFERSTRLLIQPIHIMPVQEDEEVLQPGVDTQLFQIPPGLPGPQEEQVEQEEHSGDAQENSLVLKCVMEDSRDPLHAFQECEFYFFGVNSGSEDEVPEDDLTDEMEDIVATEEVQLSPGSIPLEDCYSRE